jgi:hypothetical protein
MNRIFEGNPSEAEPAQNPRLDCQAKLKAYWRLDDVVCRDFLKLGTTPADFEAVRLLFPYVRETAFCQTPREWKYLADWLYFGFFAGHELGCRHPELAEQILPGNELKEALRRLGILIECAKEEHLSAAGLDKACKEVAESHRPAGTSDNANTTVCTLLLKTMRAGVAAGTVVQTDPALSDALGNFGKPVGAHLPGILERALVMSALRMFEEGFASRPWHPLLRLTRELYPPDHSFEGNIVRAFVTQRLQQLGVTKEEDYAADDLDLLDWIAAGLEYGRQVKRRHPRLLVNLAKESVGKRLEASKSLVLEAVTNAGHAEPYDLLRPLLEWYKAVHHKEDPGFYGQRLARFGAIADFAVWIPWLAKEKPSKGSGRGTRSRKSGNTNV